MSIASHLRRWFFTDWRQWLYPGPKRTFTPEEMARAGAQRWPAFIDQYVYVNLIIILSVFSIVGRSSVSIWLAGLGLSWASLAVARWLWKTPTRWRLNVVCWATAGLGGFVIGFLDAVGMGGKLDPYASWAAAVSFPVLTGWWVLTEYRAQLIASRLRELDEQEAALKLSTRLAAAQIQPHFLFNTLASLQHWVDTGDSRAAPLLREFTAYLRATLPMFERELQPLSDEMEMVRHYLAIMQTRLGDRLIFTLDVPADENVQLPPGVVLTLVENAIAHGIEPQLRGGRVDIAARRQGGRLVLTVHDDGPGLAPGCSDDVGLSNTRRRLLNACPNATLTLADAHPGCIATLTL